jgi:hypothetical protein
MRLPLPAISAFADCCEATANFQEAGAMPHHGDIPSALQPCPIMAIFLRPYSRTLSWQYSYGLTAALFKYHSAPTGAALQYHRTPTGAALYRR